MLRFEKLVPVTAPVIVLLNTLGPIISGIWLVILGQWKLVLVSFIVTALFAARLLGIALLPQIALAAPGIYFAKQQNKALTYLFSGLSHLYAAALIVVWSTVVLSYFAPSNAPNAAGTAAPYLIWAYGVAVSPWTYMALHENRSGDSLAPLFCFFLQLGFIGAVLAILLLGASVEAGGLVILGAMAIALCAVIPIAGHQMLLAGAYQALDEKVNSLTGRQ